MAGPRPSRALAEDRRPPRRRNRVLASGLAAVALGAALGIGAYAVLTATSAALPPAVIGGARPVGLTATDDGTSVVFTGSWARAAPRIRRSSSGSRRVGRRPRSA